MGTPCRSRPCTPTSRSPTRSPPSREARARHAGPALDGVHADDARHGVHGLPARDRARRGRVVAQGRSRLGQLPRPTAASPARARSPRRQLPLPRRGEWPGEEPGRRQRHAHPRAELGHPRGGGPLHAGRQRAHHHVDEVHRTAASHDPGRRYFGDRSRLPRRASRQPVARGDLPARGNDQQRSGSAALVALRPKDDARRHERRDQGISLAL